MKDPLKGKAEGAIIEVIVDMDSGTLSYLIRADGMRVTEGFLGVSGFPPGEALRPWAHLGNPGDEVVLSTPPALEPPAYRPSRRAAQFSAC